MLGIPAAATWARDQRLMTPVPSERYKQAMPRFLRPGFLVLTGEQLWVVDEFQPVAAILDPVTGTVRRLVSWTELPPPPPKTFASSFFGWRVVGAATPRLWVQPFRDGPVALISPDGLVHASPSDELRLSDADPRGAWCIPQNALRDLTPSRALLIIRPDGTITPSRAETPVRSLRAMPDGVWVRVDLPPPERPEDGRTLSELTTWLRLPGDQAVPRQLTLAAHRVEPAEQGKTPKPPGPFFEVVHHLPGLPAPEAAGLVWNIGTPYDDPIGHRIHAVGHDPANGEEHRRVDLGGPGHVHAALAASGLVWVAMRRSWKNSPYTRDAVELLRFDPTRDQVANDQPLHRWSTNGQRANNQPSGKHPATKHPVTKHRATKQPGGKQPETVLPPESLEITELCWPLPAKPAEAESYIREQRASFGNMRWPGINDLSVEVTGTWPDSTMQIAFTHTSRPGLRLMHSLPLFDELGRLQPPDHAGVHLWEDLGTNNLPPASEAVNGILHV